MKQRLIAVCFGLLSLGFAWALDQLTNLPTIYIETEGHAAIESKEDYVPGTVTVVSGDEEVAITDKAMGIRGRGNSTWSMAKKPYRIKFDKKLNFMGQNAKAKSWVLLANHADKTLMRNAVAFEISRFMGFEFSPANAFADVVLNGKYIGNYCISDQMQVNPGRVEIDEMDATCISGEELTGGYFLEIDGFGASEPVHFTTSKGLLITIKSPDEELIQQVQINYITNFINRFESKLFAENYTDPEQGYRSMVDEKSLIDWYIACELTGNPDSWWSTYIYKKRSDDHIYFGPLWDFDIAFNNDNRLGDAARKLMRNDGFNPRTWIERFWSDQWFRTAVYDRWKQLVALGIEQHLTDYITQTAELIDASQKKNFQTWNVLNRRVYNEQFLFNTYGEGVDFLKSYVSSRIAFLTESFKSSGEVSHIDDIRDGSEYFIVHYNGLYATPEEANFYIENADFDRQHLAFVSAGDGKWNIRTSDGRLVAAKQGGDKYCTYLSDGSDPYAQFIVEKSRFEGYAKIKNVALGSYLGIENQAHMSRISTNKNGNETNHAWKILDTKANTADLEAEIDRALEILANAKVGIEPGCYPQAAVDSLNAAIDAARQALLSDDQAEIDAATDALSRAISEFLAQRILNNNFADIDADTYIDDADALATGAYNIVNPDALLVFENIKPLDVLAQASQLAIGGKPFVVDDNARISIYKQGTVIVPRSKDFAPLTAFTLTGCAGDSICCLPEIFYSNSPDSHVKDANKKPLEIAGNIKSFTLKRGYMATLATEPDGMGYSYVFIADKADLTVDELPAEFEGRVNFIRVFPWQWTSKKGWVGGNSSLTNPEGFIEDQCEVTNSTWVYTWGPNADWARNPKVRGTAWRDQEFVPQKWGAGGDGDWVTIYNQTGSNHLLGYNEPDHSEQANVGVDKAIAEWPLFVKTGMRLGTPSTTDFWWLYDFMDKARAKGYRVDFAAIHAYWGGSGGAVVVSGLADWKSKLEEIHERTGLPIWITEWNNGANWTHETWPMTEAEQFEKQRQFISSILPMFDEMECMERYSIYNWVEKKRSMFNGSLDLTPAGQVYADYNADFAYQTREQKPDDPDVPGDDSLSGIAADSGSLVFDPECLIVKTSEPAVITVYSADGRVAARSVWDTFVSVASLPHGIYVALTDSGAAIKFAR